MPAYMIRKADDEDKTNNKKVEAVSPRAARRQYRKSNGLHPTTALICK